jgi:hypothetical protein
MTEAIAKVFMMTGGLVVGVLVFYVVGIKSDCG